VVIFPLLGCLAWKQLQIGTGNGMLLIITGNGHVLFNCINIDDLEWLWTPKISMDFQWFYAIFGCRRVNCDEMDGGRPRLPENRNCYRLSRVAWALAQISCLWTSRRTTAREEGKRKTERNVTELVSKDKRRVQWISTTEGGSAEASKIQSMRTKNLS